MLEVLPEKTKVTLSVDANALLFMQRTFGKRGVGEKISELIFELQKRRQAEARSRRRLAAVSKVNEGEGSIWLYG
jgi:predicted acetyltransferase